RRRARLRAHGGGGDRLERLHVREDAVEFLDVACEPLLRQGEPRELRDVPHVVRCHRHQSIPRSRPAKAITSRFRPTPSSSKSTVTFASFPLPLTSAIVPDPNVRCVTRSPRTNLGASC